MKDYKIESAELIQKLIKTRREILETAEALSTAKQREVFLGIWSARELLAHLAGWDFTNLEAAKSILKGELPGFYAFIDKDWQTYNKMLVERNRREEFSQQVLLASQSHQELVDYLRSLPDGDIWIDRGIRARGWKVTIARLLQAELGDEEIHLIQLQNLAEGGKNGANHLNRN